MYWWKWIGVVEAEDLQSAQGARTGCERGALVGCRLVAAHRLDGDRLDDERSSGHQESVLLPIPCLERRRYVRRILAGGNLERGVRAFVLEVERADGADAPLLNALLLDLGPCFLLQFGERRLELRE